MRSLIKNIYRLKSIYRKIFLIAIDAFLIELGLFILIWALRNLQIEPYIINDLYWFFILLPFLGILIYLSTGQYISISKYISSKDLYRLIGRDCILLITTFCIGKILNLPIPFFAVWLLMGFLITTLKMFIRLIIRDNIRSLNFRSNEKVNRLIIYGAGDAGVQLANNLKLNRNNSIKYFLDDNKELWGRSIEGILIKSPKIINSLQDKIDKVLIAIPSLNNGELGNLIKKMGDLRIPIMKIPSLNELTSGEEKISSLKPIPIEELLHRKEVNNDKNELKKGIEGKVIFITGAGGSIGSEITKQLLILKPKKLIIMDKSEENLYIINRELNCLINKDLKVKIIPILGDCSKDIIIKKLFKENNIDIVFHAAAYKHVPMVEANPIEGLYNNVKSSQVICEAAVNYKISEVILISSDKAVRPSSIMGVSKRISELIFQAFDFECKIKQNHKNKELKSTKFAMVRFGNVLASSGSVVPLFEKQIKEGGPVTLTHKNVTRYFMTIKEAVQLVLISSFLAEGGEVFILDMGKPIKVRDLAYKMINLSGLRVKDKSEPDGDIEIVETGLRAGEKLYEELLIDNNCAKTSHPLIYKAKESFIEPDLLWNKLSVLYKHLEENDLNNTFNTISEIVPYWKSKY